MKKYFIVFIALFLASACAVNFERSANAPANSAANENTTRRETVNVSNFANLANKNAETNRQAINPRAGQSVDEQIKADCLKLRRSGKVPDANQTLAINFEPFADACFVAFHDAEYTNPALNTEFYIYRDGREIFEFPNQFNGVTTGCWIEAVSFADLNDDKLDDIVVAGMCSAKSAPYSENMVYVNTGESFTTDENANYKLADFKKIKEIENFVRRSQQLFFK